MEGEMRYICAFFRLRDILSIRNKFLLLLLVSIIVFTNTTFAQIIWTEDWESGIGNWYADNGVWEVGMPTSGFDSAYSVQTIAKQYLKRQLSYRFKFTVDQPFNCSARYATTKSKNFIKILALVQLY